MTCRNVSPSMLSDHSSLTGRYLFSHNPVSATTTKHRSVAHRRPVALGRCCGGRLWSIPRQLCQLWRCQRLWDWQPHQTTSCVSQTSN